MSDENLLIPDKRIVSIEEARAAADAREAPRAKRMRKPNDVMGDYATRGDMVNGFLAAANKMYEQMSGEVDDVLTDFADQTSMHLEAMEARLEERIRREFYRRSWRGRLERHAGLLHEWARGYLMEMGLISPVTPAPAIALVEEPAASPYAPEVEPAVE